MLKVNKYDQKTTQNFDGVNPFANIATTKFFNDPETTPEGFLLVDCILGRQCVLPYTYITPEGNEITRFEFLGPDILSEQFRLSTEGAPFVLEHPQDSKGNFVDVTPENYTDFIKGTVIRPRHVNVAGETMLIGTLKIFDPEVIDLIVSKQLNEVSQGYLCRVADTPGVFNGTKYDSIQTDFTMNHLALVNEGRAGQGVKILFNSKTKKEVLEFVHNSKNKKIIGGSKMKPEETKQNDIPKANQGPLELDQSTIDNKQNQGGMPNQPDPMRQQNMPEGGMGMNPMMMQMLQMLMQMMGGGGMMQNAGSPVVPQGQFQPFNTGFNGGGNSPFLPNQNSAAYISQMNNQQAMHVMNDNNKINDLIVNGVKESQEALLKGASIYGNSASSEFLKHNTAEEFKKQALKDSKIIEDSLIEKLNSAQINAYFDVATSVAKSQINSPSVSSQQEQVEMDEFV